jgi:hypothetical protein
MKIILRGVFLGSFTSKKGKKFARVLDAESQKIVLVSGVDSQFDNLKLGENVLVEVEASVRFADFVSLINK